MRLARAIVREISGRSYRECYDVLTCALEVVHSHSPKRMDMRNIAAEAGALLGKEGTAVARALARAAEDAWDHGGRKVLEEKYGFREKPSPKELVVTLSYVMEESPESDALHTGNNG